MFASSVIRIISTERRTENLNDLQLINIVGDAWLSALVRSCEKSLPLAGSLQASVLIFSVLWFAGLPSDSAFERSLSLS